MLKKARMQRRIENRNSGINYLLLPITHELSELICNSILDETFLSDSPILELHLQMWIVHHPSAYVTQRSNRQAQIIYYYSPINC